MPMTSAPPSIARSGELEQVVARLEDDRLDAAPLALLDQTEPSHLAAAGLRVHEEDARAGGRHRHPRRRLRSERRPVAPERVAHEEGGPAEQRQHHDQRHAVVLGGQHDGDGEHQEHDGRRRWPHLGSAPSAWPRPRPWRSPPAAAGAPRWPRPTSPWRPSGGDHEGRRHEHEGSDGGGPPGRFEREIGGTARCWS